MNESALAAAAEGMPQINNGESFLSRIRGIFEDRKLQRWTIAQEAYLEAWKDKNRNGIFWQGVALGKIAINEEHLFTTLQSDEYGKHPPHLIYKERFGDTEHLLWRPHGGEQLILRIREDEVPNSYTKYEMRNYRRPPVGPDPRNINEAAALLGVVCFKKKGDELYGPDPLTKTTIYPSELMEAIEDSFSALRKAA